MLVANWRGVLRYAWSIRLMILAALLSGLEIALPLLAGLIEIPHGVFAGLSLVVTAGATLSRLVVQTKLPEGGA